MNRFMVALGLGILVVATPSGVAQAEMPHWVSSSDLSRSSIPGLQWHSSLESGWAESKRRNVPMVIYITTQQCRYCDAMKRDTWQNLSVQQDLREGYVAIELSPQANSATLDRIDVKVYPTTLIGIPEGRIIAHRDGYQPMSVMKAFLREIRSRTALR